MLRLTVFCKYTCKFLRNYAQEANLNMKYLNVAEKNDAAKTISSLLSNGTATRREGCSVYNKIYEFETEVNRRKCKMVMTSVSGHLLQLDFVGAYRRWNEVDPLALFSAPVQKSCSENYQPILRTLEREVRSCHGLIIWTDCDREGENIGFEIMEVCRKIKPSLAVYRAVFSEITRASVHRALQQLTEPNKRLNDAVDVRTELDLRTGAAITRFQTMRLQRLFPTKIADKLISYGSCQIPTLGFVVERYKEIEAFVSEPFWKLKVSHTIDELTVDFIWARNRLFDKAACEDYLLICLADPKAKVEEVTTKPKNKWRPTPLDTVEMEKLGSRKLKISAKEIMTIAEKLYSKGIISYPRTETNQFSKDINLGALVEQFVQHGDWGVFAQRVKEWGPNPRNGNKTDQAHPPIHPTKLATDLNGNEARVYELICRHFLACVSKDAVGSETKVHINIAGEKFTATGLVIHERNYLDIYIYEQWNAKQIHKYEQGQLFDPTEISMQEGATTAPPLLTEADLIALMEKHGIGTDATHAEHINTIKERGYIGVVDKGCLVPGIIGMGLCEGYGAMDLTLAKPMLRAEFESDLKDICSGKKDPKIVLNEQIQKYLEAYRQITEKIEAMDNKMALRINETATVGESMENQNNNRNKITDLFQCPKCSVAPLALRQKKNNPNSYYIGCMNFPNCNNAIWLSEECSEPSVLSETCQHCGPNVKLIKLKFTSLYYKTLFKTPSGWYKTCLCCDQQFRDNFEINLDQVKRTGGIVGVVGIGSNTTSSNQNPTAASVTGSTSRGSESTNVSGEYRNASGSRNLNKKQNRGKSKPDIETNASTKGDKKKTNSKTQGIRTFFTSAAPAQNRADQSSIPMEIENCTINDVILDDFFNNDDGFDEMLCTFEIQNETTGNATTSAVQNSTNLATSVGTGPIRQVNDIASINNCATGNPAESAYLNFDESFPDLSDFVWGTAEHNSRSSTAAQLPNEKKEDRTKSSETAQYSCSSAQRNLAPDIGIQCPGCHQQAKQCTVRKSGPNNGRLFYVCAKKNPCKFFQWADEASTASSITVTSTSAENHPPTHSTSPLQSEFVKCNCGIPALTLIVRKEGPNKGRPFYTCSNREASCTFFKWKYEDSSQVETSGSSNQSDLNWGTKPHSSQGSSGETFKKRRCGLCRQESHTRAKCPRKSEFDY
ncbi:DNA topoisomerase 3-alpha isoform X1 [Anastrepha obliqua]|uniref:DNA topoisomerase 3-alpha isoform X1 n=1 Tax=Anastrepha obliqua TaxID=95512 RepID=UPI0024097AF8|nr:DNA topoisomerase 3-alpha isoform X1 [Anastrepha obliqua]